MRHDSKRFVLFLTAFLVVFTIVYGSLSVAAKERGQKPEEKAPPIGKPLDVMLLLDQSGSMKTSDPQNVRVPSAQFLVDYLSSTRTSYFDTRMGVINFGSVVPENDCIGPTPLDSVGQAQVKDKIKPLDLGNTDVLKAFVRAKELFDKSKSQAGRPARKKVMVLYTDGEPDVDSIPASQLFTDIINYYRANLSDVQLYVIGLDQTNQFWPQDLPYWEQIAPGRCIQMVIFNETTLKKVFADIAAQSFSDEKFTWAESSEADIDIEPYLESMNVVLLKGSPDSSIEVTDLNGKKYSMSSPETKYNTPAVTILTFEDPSSGKWHYKVTGPGKATIGFNKIPVKVRLLFPDPARLYPQGRDFHILATFQKRDGSEVSELPGIPLFPGATITRPDGSIQDVKLDSAGDMTYESQEVIRADQTGQYKIRLYLKGGATLSETSNDLSVSLVPYVVPEKLPGDMKVGATVQIMAKIYIGGRHVGNPKEYFPKEDIRSIMFVVPDPVPASTSIVKGKGYFMEPDGTGLFRSKEFRLDSPGDYSFTIHLEGVLPSGGDFVAINEVVRTLVEKRFSPWPYIIGLICLLVLSALLASAFYMHRPRLSGTVSIVFKGESILQDMRIPWRHGSYTIKCRLPEERGEDVMPKRGLFSLFGLKPRSEGDDLFDDFKA